MKKLILALTLSLALSAQTHAAPVAAAQDASDICAAFYDMSVNVAKGRDAGVPLTAQYRQVEQSYATQPDSVKFIKKLMAIIYQFPTLTPQQAGALNFRNCTEQLAKSNP